MRKAMPAAAASTTILHAAIPVRMAAVGKRKATPQIVGARLPASATTVTGLRTMKSRTTLAARARPTAIARLGLAAEILSAVTCSASTKATLIVAEIRIDRIQDL